MTDNHDIEAREVDCPRCGEPTDPDLISDHPDLGWCCYGCACRHDFPPDVEWSV